VLRAPEAIAVATATADGIPSVRMVLLKQWGPAGFDFFTNYDSRKSHELTTNPRAALLVYWEPLGAQVRVEGPVRRLSPEASDAYFATRDRLSQIGAHASHQSRPIDSRRELDDAVETNRAAFEGGEVPRPPWWGGWRVEHDRIEFWRQRDNRLHDRLRYQRRGGSRDDPATPGWTVERLQP
jgi:pyridoxamine 5'-phosphate oxidase